MEMIAMLHKDVIKVYLFISISKDIAGSLVKAV